MSILLVICHFVPSLNSKKCKVENKEYSRTGLKDVCKIWPSCLNNLYRGALRSLSVKEVLVLESFPINLYSSVASLLISVTSAYDSSPVFGHLHDSSVTSNMLPAEIEAARAYAYCAV